MPRSPLTAAVALAAALVLPLVAVAPAFAQAKPAAAAPASAAKEDARWTALQGAKGFGVGPTMAARTAYILFDAQCPHCATLWEMAKPLKSNVRLVWVPVRLLGPSSLTMGSAILAAPDPAVAMEDHEAARAKGGRGIDVKLAKPAQTEQVQANTAIFERLQANAVPFIVYRDPSGAVRTHDGAMSTADLRTFLGI